MAAFPLPIVNPVLIFSLILFMVLVAKVFLQRLNIPAVAGMILFGVVLGPNGLNLLARNDSMVLFGTVGLLYIMLAASLEIDIADFQKNRHKSALFALFSFGVPMVLALTAGRHLLGLDWPPALLLGAMVGSHTLLAFPVAQQLGIAKNRAIATAVGGSVLTDSAALGTLTLVAALEGGEADGFFWGMLALKIVLFLALVAILLPKLARWYFKVNSDSVSQYIFVLAMVFLVAYGALLVGLEPIIGAFYAGLTLNRFILPSSPLMNRIDFIGNAIFIPFFLIGVGMMVDPRVFVQGTETLLTAGFMVATVLLGKGLGACLTGLILKFRPPEWQAVFGLTIPQAAATLAVAFVGLNLGLFTETILNGTVVMILVTSLVGSLLLERAGARVAETETQLVADLDETPQRVLVAVEDSMDIEGLMELAMALKEAEAEAPVMALNVVREGAETETDVVLSGRMLEQAVKIGSATECEVQVVTRIAPSVAVAIARVAREARASDVLIAWDGQLAEKEDLLYGDVLDKVIKRTTQSVWVNHLRQPVNTFNRIVLVLPPRTELEEGYLQVLKAIKHLARETSAQMVLAASTMSLRYARAAMQLEPVVECETVKLDDWRELDLFVQDRAEDDLLVLLSARAETISFGDFLQQIPRVLAKRRAEGSFIVIYPAQSSIGDLRRDLARDLYQERFGGNRRRVQRLLKKELKSVS